MALENVNHFVAEMDDFADCILTDKPTRVPGEEGRRDMRIVEATYEAASSGRTVKL
jgi:predicted dehydrogenase